GGGRGTGDSGGGIDETELMQHAEALANGRDVSEIPARQNDPVRRPPAELLGDLDAHGLLALDSKRIQRVREIDVTFGAQLLNDPHASIEIRLQGADNGAVRDRLKQLGSGDLAFRKKDECRDSCSGTIR